MTDKKTSQFSKNRNGKKPTGAYSGKKPTGAYGGKSRDGDFRKNEGERRDGGFKKDGFKKDVFRKDGEFKKDGFKKDGDFRRSKKPTGAYGGKSRDGDFRKNEGERRDGGFKKDGFKKDVFRKDGEFKKDGFKKDGDFRRGKKPTGAYGGKSRDGDFRKNEGERKDGGFKKDGFKKDGVFRRGKKPTGAYASKSSHFDRQGKKSFRSDSRKSDFRAKELKFILQTQQTTDEKLQKVLANYGLGSRRTMEEKIQLGQVLVNGEVAELGARVSSKDKLKVDGKELETQVQARRLLIYNKPEGEVVTRYDEEDRDLVFEHLPHLPIGRWIPVGRLDINTSGLLLFTNDGQLADALMHPSNEMEREYMVRVLGRVSNLDIEKLKTGVALEDGMANFSSIEPLKMKTEGEEKVANSWFKVKLKQGRNRLVRRLWEALGFSVSRLKRINFGGIHLNREDEVGKWREVSVYDLEKLSKDLNLEVNYANESQVALLGKIMRMDKKLVSYSTKNQVRKKAFSRPPSASRVFDKFAKKSDFRKAKGKKSKDSSVPKIELGRNRPAPKEKLVYKNPKLQK